MMDMAGDGAEQAMAEDHAIEAPPRVVRDERRMHVRAYNVWAAMLRGRQFPTIADLDPAHIADFAAHGVLLDLGGDADDPAIAWLGEALRLEADLGAAPERAADAPERSLLSRLSRHCAQVVANRAPVGFEAESLNVRDNLALYRGILMPFSSDGVAIDFIYGVVNWKELVDPALAAEIVAAARSAMAVAPRAPSTPLAPVWADGPSRAERTVAPAAAMPTALATMFADLRDAGARHAAASRAATDALHEALGAAYDLACAADADTAGYAALLARAGIAPDRDAPWRTMVTLLFGDAPCRASAETYAAILRAAWRRDVPQGALPAFIAAHGGIPAIADEERADRDDAAG